MVTEAQECNQSPFFISQIDLLSNGLKESRAWGDLIYAVIGSFLVLSEAL